MNNASNQLSEEQLRELNNLFNSISDRQIKDFGNITASNKADGSLITSCDIWSDKKIVEGLAKIAPNEGILSEEGEKVVPGAVEVAIDLDAALWAREHLVTAQVLMPVAALGARARRARFVGVTQHGAPAVPIGRRVQPLGEHPVRPREHRPRHFRAEDAVLTRHHLVHPKVRRDNQVVIVQQQVGASVVRGRHPTAQTRPLAHLLLLQPLETASSLPWGPCAPRWWVFVHLAQLRNPRLQTIDLRASFLQ